MIKIPVGQTIRFAYDFTFKHIGVIIGLIWIPKLVSVVADYFATKPYYEKLVTGGMSASALAVGPERLIMLANNFLSMLLFAVIVVAVTRQALGLRQGPAIAHFSFGLPELRIFGASVALGFLMLIFLFGFLLFLLALDAGSGLAPKDGLVGGLMALVVFLGTCAGFCALIYVVVRLTALYVPASVTEGDFGIERGWQLTRGNFWRIIGVWLGALGPILLLVLIGFCIIVGPDFFPTDYKMLTDTGARTQYQMVQTRILLEKMPILMGLDFAIAPFIYGLMLASCARVYQVLTAKPSTDLMT